jgi:hypothetical protein
MKEENKPLVKFRLAAKKKDWVRRDYYATPVEHGKLKSTLIDMRKGK